MPKRRPTPLDPMVIGKALSPAQRCGDRPSSRPPAKSDTTPKIEYLLARLRIHLGYKNEDRCREILMAHFHPAEIETDGDPWEATWSTVLEDIRLCNSLERAGFDTIGSVKALGGDDHKLLGSSGGIPGFGEHSLKRVRAVIAEIDARVGELWDKAS